ncbi:EF-hand domain-containing protein [Dongia sp.]|uniref:EF-hand domain-containing protein n=1 Tax=Dongia sp. TaxID=1977262 RepID=UPI0035ADE2CF
MRIPLQSALLLSFLLELPITPVPAQETNPAAASTVTLDAMPFELLVGLLRQSSVEEFSAGMLNQFRNVADGDGVLNAQIIADKAAIAAAGSRANRIEEILRADLDGDGSVTRAEMEKSKASRRHGNTAQDQTIIEQQRNAELDRAMAPDGNADGVITFEEMRQAAADSVAARGDQRGDRATALLAMDGDGDGSVTLREVRAAAQAIFARFDTNGDGEIGEVERKALAEQYEAIMLRHRQRELIAGCTLPPIPEGQRLVLLSAQRGRDLTTVSVAGQDESTWSGEVAIQPGDDKLWIVAAAGDPMIWRLTGAVDRVARFVVIPHYSRDRPVAGVTGLATDQVTFAKGPQCRLRELMQSSRRDPQMRSELLRELLGRDPDDVVAAPDFLRVSLPGGETLAKPAAEPERPAQVPEQVWRSVRRYGSGVPVAVDAASVIAAGKVEPYEVLPEEAGLLQLLIDGAIVARATGNSKTVITLTEQGQVSSTTYDYIFDIVKPIARFPGGLGGGRPITFQLAPGVPMPAGDPGRSCVRDSTGQVLAMKILCDR